MRIRCGRKCQKAVRLTFASVSVTIIGRGDAKNKLRNEKLWEEARLIVTKGTANASGLLFNK
jgi:hypothetical protein